jgi:hypothetical protein
MALCNTIAEFGSYDGWLLMGNEVWARFARTSWRTYVRWVASKR